MYVAIMGYGVVGSGVAEVLAKNHLSITKKSMQSELELKYILDIRDFPGDPNENLLIKDFNINCCWCQFISSTYFKSLF